MKLLVVVLALLAPGALGQQVKEAASPSGAARIEAEFVGTYRPDGKFKKAGKTTRVARLKDLRADAAPGQKNFRPVEVPPWINLHPLEATVEDYEKPPAPASTAAKAPSMWANLRDDVITFIYGHERALLGPTRVTTDSKHRLIISDPQGPSIHVLDPRKPFRIIGGPGRRLQHPEGVAVDGQDNIYVADSKRRMVLMYDPQGQFVGELGTYRGENIFAKPTGIAIDRTARHLYVLDSPSHELVVLDLQGNVLRRAGGRRGHAGVKFDYPSEIAVREGAIIVLDAVGTRIQVLNPECKLVHAFNVRPVRNTVVLPEMGLALDNAANIYVGAPGASSVRVYKQNGEPISFLEPTDAPFGKVSEASGLWIDPADRIYISTTSNSRVQVFQLKRAATQ